jgi:HEAT repeat protein
MNTTYRTCYGVAALLVVCLAVQTVSALTVDELLAELPAKDSAHAAQVYGQLAAGDESVITALCDSVVLWTEGANPKVPMALHGLASYVMQPENGANRGKVARLYEAALNRADSPDKQHFFMQMLRSCGDGDSVAVITTFLCNVDVFEDAVQTLETIGGESAMAALENANCTDMPEDFAIAVNTALMRMRNAVMFEKDSTGLDALVLAATSAAPTPENREQVAALCREALENKALKPHVQALALRALVNSEGPDALPDIMKAAGNDAPVVWGMALQLATSMPGDEVSRAWATQLDALPETVQPQVIYMLGGRDDRHAKDAIRKALISEDADMRLAACDAVARFTEKEGFLPALERAMLAAESKKDVESVKRAMLQFPEPDLSKMAARRTGRGDVLQRTAYLEIIAARHGEQHAGSVRKCLKDKTPEVRRAAMNALAVIGAQEDMETMFTHLVTEESAQEVNAAQNALVALADKHVSRPALLAQIQNAFPAATLDIRKRLLKTLGNLGDKEALTEVGIIAEAALLKEEKDLDLGNAALEVLGTWQDVQTCDVLLSLLERMETPETRTVIVKQILTAAPRVFTNPRKQMEFLEKAQAVLTAEDEKQPLVDAIEKIKAEKEKR